MQERLGDWKIDYNSGRAAFSKGGVLQINLLGKGLTPEPSMGDIGST